MNAITATATHVPHEWPFREARAVVAVSALALAALASIHSDSMLFWPASICSTPPGSAADQTALSAGRPATTVRPLSCEPLPNVPGKSVTTVIVDFPPRAFTGAHRHPGSVTAYVLEGVVRSQMEGTPAADYHAGQTWFEAPYALHAFAENPDPARPAKLLAVFVTDTGCGQLVLPP
ncbi:cupin domain-containing protein [Paraburkholderia ferrariae]|uniref:cupin domain-containing protein n=1 Tax=Paraburkholderia ferrariae TaxID=386056 RepID=UPI0005A8A45E|nr:cupin domain-containing protein [Paraburkholderia ferrariae]